MVRSSGHRPHQGWDLLAQPGSSPTYAICNCVIEYRHEVNKGDYGIFLVVRPTVERKPAVIAGAVIGYTGITGNAKHTSPHLHFESTPVSY